MTPRTYRRGRLAARVGATLALAAAVALAPVAAAMPRDADTDAPSLDFLPWKSRAERDAHRDGYKVTVPVPPPARGVRLPKVAGAEGRPLVVIDAGHGGNDPGAVNPRAALREKDVTLKIAKAIRDALVEGGRARVALTRDDDRYIPNRSRSGM